MNPDDNRREAANLAKRSGRQGKHAVRNAGKAAQVAAQPVLEEVQAATEEVVKKTKRVSPLGLSHLSGNTGQGFLAMSVAIYAGVYAANKFRGVYINRDQVINAVVKTSEHISSDAAA